MQKSDSFTLHINGKASYVRGQPARPVFDDTKQFWYPETPTTASCCPRSVSVYAC